MNNLLKTISLFIITLSCATLCSAQKLDHELGEVIVEVRDQKAIRALINDLSSSKRYRSTIEYKQLMADPMNLWLLKIDQNLDNEIAFLEEVSMNRNTLLAQKNQIIHKRETTPDDPRFVDQWQYINTGQSGGIMGADLDIELAWDHATGGTTIDGQEIVVCVIDDGFNPSHPDIGDNLWVNEYEIENNGIDDDGNGYVDDLLGWNTLAPGDGNGDIDDDGGHGTPVAGIIGAQGNNGIGVAGVNWDIKMMIVVGGTNAANAIVSYAYPFAMRQLYNETNGERGAFVVSTNASWGIDFGKPEDAPIWCDFYNRMGEIGILNFGATANADTNVDIDGDLPTSCTSDYLVSVTNINQSDVKEPGSGFGLRSIDLGAYGEDTYTISRTGYRDFGGTSGATPHVAATAALLYSAPCQAFMDLSNNNPSQAALAVKDYILHGVTPNEAMSGITTTAGRLNINNAMENLLQSCGDCSQAYGAQAVEIDKFGAKLQFVDLGNLSTINLRYKAVDDSDWVSVENIASGFEFPNLKACAAYEYQIQSTCDDDNNNFTYSRVFETIGCCKVPSSIITELDDDKINISWSNFSAASSLQLEYLLDDELQWNTIDLTNEESYTITEVTDCQSYQIRIKSMCAETSNESPFTEIYKITTPCGSCTVDYCDFSTKNTSDEWIASVVIEGLLDNESGPNVNGYGNFIGQFDIPMQIGLDYPITISQAYSGTTWPEFFKVYIDYDHSGTFEDVELAFSSEETITTAAMGILSIPTDATLGITRMRIIMRYDSDNGPCDEASFEFGEIEDYCVRITGDGSCPQQYEATIVDSLSTGLLLSMPADDRVEEYVFEFREEGSNMFITLSSPENNISIGGLEPCTFYEYRTSIICNGDRQEDTDISIAKTRCSASINDQNQLDISMFPNPATNILAIESDLASNVTINIRSAATGNLISSASMVSTRSKSIDVSSLPPGLYLVEFRSGTKSSIQKLVKL